MYKNQYDTDVITWSPQGRLFQVEYAMEAVKQGSASVGMTSKTHVVLASLKRSPSELAGFQEKTFVIDDHIGISISGLTSDARYLCKYMRTEAINHRFVYDTPLQTSHLVEDVANKHHKCTQFYVRRPFGVGLLVAGVDRTGPHLFQTCPSGDFWEFKAMAIGARSQSAKTYIEKHYVSFPDVDRAELLRHAIAALNTCCGDDESLSVRNVSVGVVGPDEKFHVFTEEELAPLLAGVVRITRPGAAPAAAAAAAGVAESKSAEMDLAP